MVFLALRRGEGEGEGVNFGPKWRYIINEWLLIKSCLYLPPIGDIKEVVCSSFIGWCFFWRGHSWSTGYPYPILFVVPPIPIVPGNFYFVESWGCFVKSWGCFVKSWGCLVESWGCFVEQLRPVLNRYRDDLTTKLVGYFNGGLLNGPLTKCW